MMSTWTRCVQAVATSNESLENMICMIECSALRVLVIFWVPYLHPDHRNSAAKDALARRWQAARTGIGMYR